MASSLAVVLLVIVVVGALRYWLLPALWTPSTLADTHQDECRRRAPAKGVSATEHSPSGVVRVISLTDDGEFEDRCQLTDVIYEIRNPRVPELIVWYVHGWKHDADPGDGDLTQFESLIKELDRQQRQLGEGRGRHVVGIYVGWHGAVGLAWPAWLRNLTFWNRKRAADRISQSSVLTKIIAATKYARKREVSSSEDLTIMIGHSFGARILYTATSQILIDEVQRRHPGNKELSFHVMDGPADLIVLLNPAFEASIFTAMDSVRRDKSWEKIDQRQQPLLLAIATENDSATGRFFPWGQRLDFARRDRQRLALGNYWQYVTHSLHRVKSGNASPAPGLFWYDCFEADGVLLLRKEETHPGNPFVVARTTSDIIDGHNGIWGEALRTWMIAFLRELQQRASVS